MSEMKETQYSSARIEAIAPEVIEAYWSGTSIDDLAMIHGLHRRTIHKMLHVAGGALPTGNKRNSTLIERDAERYAEIERLVDEGLTAGEISVQTKTKRDTIVKYFPNVARRKIRPEKIVELKQQKFGAIDQDMLDWIGVMVEDETPLSEISRTTGVSVSTIKKYYPNAGVGQGKGGSVRAMFQRAEEIYKEWGV